MTALEQNLKAQAAAVERLRMKCFDAFPAVDSGIVIVMDPVHVSTGKDRRIAYEPFMLPLDMVDRFIARRS